MIAALVPLGALAGVIIMGAIGWLFALAMTPLIVAGGLVGACLAIVGVACVHGCW